MANSSPLLFAPPELEDMMEWQICSLGPEVVEWKLKKTALDQEDELYMSSPRTRISREDQNKGRMGRGLYSSPD